MKEIIKIMSYAKAFKGYYFVSAFFIILIALLSQAAPLLTKQIVDLIVQKLKGTNISVESIIILLGLILASDLAITFITSISQYIGDIMSIKINNYLSEKYYRHVLNLSIDYYDNEITGKIVSKLERGISSITNLINQSTNSFLPFFITTAVTLIIISVYSWELAIMLFILFPLYIFISHKSSVEWGKFEAQKNAINDRTNGRVFESLSSIRVVKSFIQEIVEYSFFRDQRHKLVGLTQKQSYGWHLYDTYRRLVLNFIMFGVFGYIIYFTFKGRFTIGEMTLLLQLANQARFPLFAMSFIIGQLQQAQAGSKDFFAVLETTASIKDKKDAKELKNVKGTISFNDVAFSYSKDTQVLQDIKFAVKPGQKLAIVGESGEGKSTIANLLLRFYEPNSGSITIDGTDIQDVTQISLRKNIGVVFQDTFLFSGTIMENIMYGSADASKEDVVRVAKIANADEFIKKLPNAYDTEVGERGIKLSGGQKQRISIARALLKNPPILIFDEATSSLDSKAEFEVQKGLNNLMEGRTTFIIAHRLSTIRNVDMIVVLQQGRIVECGSPADLEKQKGVYAELLSYQNGSLGEESEKKLKELHLESE
jgi:ATP-binding cassette subfamily B protein